jgi:uncharacterized protein (TIGR03067 family)
VLAAVVAAVVAVALLWPGDRDRLRGSWAGDGVRLTFEGNVVVLTGDGYREAQPAYFRLDPRASPKRITIWPTAAPNVGPPRTVLGVEIGPPGPPPGFECHGIYDLDGDRLRVCIMPPGAGFPTDFAPTGGVVFDLRRE